MIPKSFILLTAIFVVSFISCNKAAPSGFWKNYKKELLVKNISDQGPYGGHRAVYWKTDKANSFLSTDVIEFARKNGWTLIDSVEFTDDQTKKWMYNNKAVFPLTHIGFSDTLVNDAHLTDFPRWFSGQLMVYKFKTGWMTVQPGTDSSSEVNGFVVINRDGTEMSVYHLWGE